MTSNKKTTKHSDEFVPAWKSPWVWGIGAIIATTLVVNFTMITIGLNTHPGLVVDDFYAKGKSYFNAEAERSENENRLGWNMEEQPPQQIKLNERQVYRFMLTDKAGHPVNGAEVEFAAFRVNDATKDFTLPMMEVSSGVYLAEVEFSLPGNWDLIFTAKKDGGKLDSAQRIFVND